MTRWVWLLGGLSLGVACWLGAVGASSSHPPGTAVPRGIGDCTLPELAAFSVQRLDLPRVNGQPFTTQVVLDGVAWTLALHPYSLRSDAFRVLVPHADGTLHEVAPPPVATYRGQVAEVPDSRVVAALIDGKLTATIVLNTDEMWHVAPLSDLHPGAGAGAEHVVYRDTDLVGGPIGECGVDELAHSEPTGGVAGGEGGIASGFESCEIAFDADVEYYTVQGSVSAVVQDIEAVMNSVEAIYEGDLSITYEIVAVVVRTAEPDPYSSTSGSTLLDQFRSEWNANQQSIARDIAHLMTGKDLDGLTIGIAWRGTICDSITFGDGYALSATLWTDYLPRRACLTAHELGHNWDAVHCNGDADCSIMCSTIGGCTGVCNHFGSRALDAIAAFRDSRTCLSLVPGPGGLPFFDDFPTTTIDTTKWTYVFGAEINTNANNEPSPPYSLNLDAAADGTDDEIRSQVIPLDNVYAARLSYYTERLGVESGEQLVVEYWSDNLTWVELHRITSDGSGQTSFQFWSHDLPADALHDGFRFRFRPLVNYTNDDWYVDDVMVDEVIVPVDLSVSSTPRTGVSITVSPADNGGQGNGTTPFVRSYDIGTDVTLTAPLRPTAGGDALAFCRWKVDGVSLPDDQNVLVHSATADATLVAEYLVLGDMNGDDVLNNGDIPAFVQAFTDPAGYASQYPDLDPVERGDINGDGALRADDIPGFVSLLTN